LIIIFEIQIKFVDKNSIILVLKI